MDHSHEIERKCVDCGKTFINYGSRWCVDCRRAHRAKKAAELRERKRIKLMAENETLMKEGWKICSKCHHKRQLSEFRTSLPGRKGKVNSICDRCLTMMYVAPARKSEGFDCNYWRRRAYAANSVARMRLAKEKHVKTSMIRLTDLEWICKPQDLAEAYTAHDGRCRYCGVRLTPRSLQIDHLTPVARGGRHVRENLGLSCRDCNYLKSTRTESEFREFLKEYSARVVAKLAEDRDKEPDR